MVGWLAFEWGFGNETVTPWLIATVISRTSGVEVIPVTAGVGLAYTTLQQLASGFTTLAGSSMFERTSHAAWERLRGRLGTVPGEWHTLGRPARCGLVFVLGTTAVALIQVAATGQVGVRRHASVVVKSAFLCGCLVGFVGGASAGIAVVGRRVEVLSGATDWALRILANPLFWIGALAAAGLASRARRTRGARSTRD
jgi:hypothetical protein